MATKKSHTTNEREAANYVFGILLLQAISFILLGVLIITYPPFLFAFTAATLIWGGITTGIMAWRVRRFGKDVKDIEAELFGREAFVG